MDPQDFSGQDQKASTPPTTATANAATLPPIPTTLAAPPVAVATASSVELATRVFDRVFANVDCSVAGTDMLLVGLRTGTLKFPPVPAGLEAVA